MKLSEYFEKTKGTGVLATADASGKVNTAIYARPHVQDDRNLAFIMTERTAYANLQSNPHASYLFKQDGDGFSGLRLLLRKAREEKDEARIKELSRRSYPKAETGSLHLIHFEVDEILPLVSSGKCPVGG